MTSLFAQKDSIQYELGAMGLYSTGEYSNFWLHTNRNGTVSTEAKSSNLFASLKKELDKSLYQFDYGFEIKPILISDTNGSKLFFQDLYLNSKLYLFDFVMGVKPIETGNQDRELSSGGFLFSQNARPLPRISLGIDEYLAVPYTFNNLAIRGGLTHAWFRDNVYINGALMHYKFAGVRLGGGILPLSINYEFHHAAQWGGVSPVYGELGNGWRDYYNVFFSKSGGTMANDQINAQGNHIGSQQIGVDLKLKNWETSLYWQNIFEDGPIKVPWKSLNRPDGLYGISISQKQFKPVRKLVYEYLETTDQAGPTHDIDGLVFGGGDNYFRNGIYQNGWNHHFRTIGIAFISSPIYNKESNSLQTLNTRTRVHHLAMTGEFAKINYRAIFSSAKNYGTYSVPKESYNQAFMLELNKRVERIWGVDVGISLAADRGTQFGNSIGGMLSIKKRGLLINW